MLQNYILMSSVQMNQKHMESISLGVHMGLRTQRVGEYVSAEGHFRSQQMPHICKQRFEVYSDCLSHWAPRPQHQHGQDIYILQRPYRVCTWGKSTPTFCSFSCLCFMSYKLWWHPNTLLGFCTRTFFPLPASAKMKCHRGHHVTTRCQAHIKHLSRCCFSGDWKA